MTEPFIGEIRLFPYNLIPAGWATCNGQLLPINQNQALYSLLGVTYGGDGKTTFALPDLRGRVPVHVGNGVILGQAAGEETHTLSVNEIPAHTHQANASTDTASLAAPANAIWAEVNPTALYGSTPDVQMSANAIQAAGGSQPHNNMQPYLVQNFCIALQGVFPSRN